MRTGIIYCALGPSGKKYYGQTIQEFNSRKIRHIYDALHGSNTYFHRALNKHGFENFQWHLIEILHGTKKELTKLLNEKEIFYIKKYDTLYPNGYNLTKGGGNYNNNTNKHRIGKSYEEIYRKEKGNQIKKKQSNNNAHYWKNKQKDPESIKKSALGHIGNKHSQESKDKIRKALIGVKHTEERRKNISNAHKGKDFSKNFGSVRRGKDHPSYIEVSKEQLKTIIKLHTIQYMSVKQIAPIIGLNWAKILKTLRKENKFIKYDKLLKLRKLKNVQQII